MKTPRISLSICLALAIALVVGSSSQAIADNDPATILASTEAQFSYQGAASLSSSVSISQEIQIQPLTADFDPDPVGWSVDLSNSAGSFYGEISWNWSQASGAAFVWSLVGGKQTNKNSGNSNCFDAQGYCTINISSWNFADPFRFTFGADKNLGAGWWNVSVLDLTDGTLLDLGSIKTGVPINTTSVKVQDMIYRPTETDICPGDAAPNADTYFGPVVDSTGVEDVTGTSTLTTHNCANAAFGTLPSYAGTYLVYGGTKASIASPDRQGAFKPSPALTTTTPPIPDAPSNFTFSTTNGLLSLFVQVPKLAAQGVKAVYLVSPELGHPDTNPVYANLTGTSARLQVPITNDMLGQTFNVSFFSQTGFVISDPLLQTVTVPKNALQKPSGSHAIPKGISPAPTIATKVPSAPSGVNISIQGSLMTISATSRQTNDTQASAAYLVSPSLNGGSASPIQGTLAGNSITFAVQLTKALQNQVVKFSMYLSNRLGKSKSLSESYKIPAKIAGL